MDKFDATDAGAARLAAWASPVLTAAWDALRSVDDGDRTREAAHRQIWTEAGQALVALPRPLDRAAARLESIIEVSGMLASDGERAWREHAAEAAKAAAVYGLDPAPFRDPPASLLWREQWVKEFGMLQKRVAEVLLGATAAAAVLTPGETAHTERSGEPESSPPSPPSGSRGQATGGKLTKAWPLHAEAALQLIREQPRGGWTPPKLAAAVGCNAGTMRKAIRQERVLREELAALQAPREVRLRPMGASAAAALAAPTQEDAALLMEAAADAAGWQEGLPDGRARPRAVAS